MGTKQPGMGRRIYNWPTVTSRTQLSTDANGPVITDPLANPPTSIEVDLGMAMSYGQPITIWNQGYNVADDDQPIFQVFGANGLHIQPDTLTLQQEVHQFPRCGDLVNVLTWTPVKNATSYQIFLSTDLNNPLATIPATGTLIFKHYCRNCCVSDTYYLYAINCIGQTMAPAIITVPS